MTHILLVDDDKSILQNLTEFLQQEGFRVTAAACREEALRLLDSPASGFDLVLLDVSLPDGNGFALCGCIQDTYHLPVIFLTASGDEYSVVAGLNLGAEDYISKPFRPRELVSRIQAVLRRCGKSNLVLEYGGLSADPIRGTVSKGGSEIILSALEYRLLLLFLHNKGIVLSRSRLMDELWDMAGEYVNDNTLTVYIKRLREKIEDDPADPVFIRTVRGLGYKLGD